MLRRYMRIRAVKNPALRALLVADGLILTAAAMLTPIYAIYVVKVGGDIFEAGLTAAALAIGAGVASIIFGNYTDTLKDKKQILVVGYVVLGLSFLLYLIVDSIWMLALVQLLIGLAHPIYQPAYDALYSKHLDKGKEAEEWGAWEATAHFTAAFGAILGGFVASQFGFAALFVAMSVLCFVSAGYVFRLQKQLL